MSQSESFLNFTTTPKIPKLEYCMRPKVNPNVPSISQTLKDTELKPGSKEAADDEYEVFYEELKPLWTTLRIVGCLPIQKPDKGKSTFKFMSQPMLYAIFYIAVQITLNTFITIIHINNNPEKSMADFIFWCMRLVLGVQPIVIAVCHWWKAGEISNLMNDWMAFQDQYYLVTSSRLDLRLRRVTIMHLVGAIAFNVIVVAIFNEWSTTKKAICSCYTGYCYFIMNLHLVFWCVICEATKRAAEALMASLKQDFVSSGQSTAQLVHEYRCLWLQLSHLTIDIGNAFCYAFGFICTVWVTNVLFSIYVLLVAIFNKTEESTLDVFIYWAVVSISISLICNYASWCTVAVGDNIKKRLTELRTTDKETREQLLHFDLTISSNEPTISFGGFVTVNRQLLISICATVVTYMVVLLQYKKD